MLPGLNIMQGEVFNQDYLFPYQIYASTPALTPSFNLIVDVK